MKFDRLDALMVVIGVACFIAMLCGAYGTSMVAEQPARIRASSIEITGPGGQIVIMVDNDKPVLRVIDSKKVGGVDRSVENLFSERAK